MTPSTGRIRLGTRRSRLAMAQAQIVAEALRGSTFMPGKLDGRAVLGKIKEDSGLRRIPVVVLTTSAQEEDILRSYELGVNSYITKPSRMDAFIEAVRNLERYWLNPAVLPDER